MAKKYVVTQLLRVLLVIRVEAEDEEEAFVKADSILPSLLPPDSDSIQVLGIQDGSTHVIPDGGWKTIDIVDILENEED
jgi:hypothetical protein